MRTKNRLVFPRPLGSLVIGSVSAIALLFLASCQTTTTEETQVMPTGKMSGSILDSRLSCLQKEAAEYPKKDTLHYQM